jgi:hypothetical protein
MKKPNIKTSKQEKKELREKAKQLENAELELKAQKHDKTIEEKAYSNPAAAAASSNAQPSTNPQSSSADSSTQPSTESSPEASSVTVIQSPTTLQVSQTQASIIVNTTTDIIDKSAPNSSSTTQDTTTQSPSPVTPVMTRQVQTGWSFDSESPTKRQRLQLILPIDTGAEVSVTQDGVNNYYNFSNEGQGRPTGSIVIIQRSPK